MRCCSNKMLVRCFLVDVVLGDDVTRGDLQCGEANQKKLCATLDTHLHAVPSLNSSSSSVS